LASAKPLLYGPKPGSGRALVRVKAGCVAALSAFGRSFPSHIVLSPPVFFIHSPSLKGLFNFEILKADKICLIYFTAGAGKRAHPHGYRVRHLAKQDPPALLGQNVRTPARAKN